MNASLNRLNSEQIKIDITNDSSNVSADNSRSSDDGASYDDRCQGDEEAYLRHRGLMA